MKCQVTAIYSLNGVNRLTEAGNTDLLVDATENLRVVLTSKPETYSHEGDRKLAVAKLVLGAAFCGQGPLDPLDVRQRVATIVTEIQESRRKTYSHGAYLVFQQESDALAIDSSLQCEVDDFAICLGRGDVAPKRFDVIVTNVITSLAITADSLRGIKKVANSVVTYREDGKPIYCYEFGGSADVCRSRAFPADRVPMVSDFYRLLAADESLQRIQRLLRLSLEAAKDPLRSFIWAWAALEVFTNKTFGIYLERVQDVRKDKYSLGDKFSVIAVHVSRESACADLNAFENAKRLRNKFYHGEPVDESSLPAECVRELACRYLRLHLEGEQRCGGKL